MQYSRRRLICRLSLYLIIYTCVCACSRVGLPQDRARGSQPASLPSGSGLADRNASPLPFGKSAFTSSVPKVLGWPGALQASLDSLVRTDTLLHTTQLGLCVYDLTADSLLYAYGAAQRLRPASTQKVITAVSALLLLGTDYALQTRLCVTGRVNGGTLRGDVYVVGGFDPCLDEADVTTMVRALKQAGIRRVEGRFCADLTMKDTLHWGQGWCWDDDNPTLTPLLCGEEDGFAEAWFRALRKQGVTYGTRRLYEEACPPDARPLHTVSRPIAEVLPKMMKKSDNLYAESLFYHLATRSGKPCPGQPEAAEEINNLLAQWGFDPARYRMADGSGLSLYNYASAELEVAFLRRAHADAAAFAALWPTLPIAGVDGTLKRRLIDTPAYGRIHAKTGSVTGVSTLAGYATARNGHLLAFSIMNQGVAHGRDGRDFQDKVCILLCK